MLLLAGVLQEPVLSLLLAGRVAHALALMAAEAVALGAIKDVERPAIEGAVAAAQAAILVQAAMADQPLVMEPPVQGVAVAVEALQPQRVAVAGLDFWVLVAMEAVEADEILLVVLETAAVRVRAAVRVGLDRAAPGTLALAAHMAAVAVLALTAAALERRAVAQVAQSVSSGPVQRVASHRQTQETCNAKLFWNLVTHAAVSSSGTEHLACGSRCAYDWYGHIGKRNISLCDVYCPCLYGIPRWNLFVYSYFYARLHYRIRRFFSNYCDGFDNRHGIYFSSTCNRSKRRWAI